MTYSTPVVIQTREYVANFGAPVWMAPVRNLADAPGFHVCMLLSCRLELSCRIVSEWLGSVPREQKMILTLVLDRVAGDFFDDPGAQALVIAVMWAVVDVVMPAKAHYFEASSPHFEVSKGLQVNKRCLFGSWRAAASLILQTRQSFLAEPTLLRDMAGSL